MIKRSENRKIKTKEREWDKILHPYKKFWCAFIKEIKFDFKTMFDFLMYSKKPTDKIDRFVHELQWWFFIVSFIMIGFFALKGFTYWLTGR